MQESIVYLDETIILDIETSGFKNKKDSIPSIKDGRQKIT